MIEFREVTRRRELRGEVWRWLVAQQPKSTSIEYLVIVQ